MLVDCSLSASSTIVEFCCNTFSFKPHRSRFTCEYYIRPITDSHPKASTVQTSTDEAEQQLLHEFRHATAMDSIEIPAGEDSRAHTRSPSYSSADTASPTKKSFLVIPMDDALRSSVRDSRLTIIRILKLVLTISAPLRRGSSPILSSCMVPRDGLPIN